MLGYRSVCRAHYAKVRGDLRDVIACCEGQLKQTNDLRAILHSLNRGIVFKVGLIGLTWSRSHPAVVAQRVQGAHRPVRQRLGSFVVVEFCLLT